MTLALLFPLGDEVALVTAHVVGVHRPAKFGAQLLGPGDGAGFQQVGEDGHILPRRLAGFLQAAHAVANIQFQVPQQGDEAAQVFVPALFDAVAGEDQQVDIGMGMQLAASVPANRQQRNVTGPGIVVAVPDLPQYQVNRVCAGFHQIPDVRTTAERLRIGLVGALEQLPGGLDRRGSGGDLAG